MWFLAGRCRCLCRSCSIYKVARIRPSSTVSVMQRSRLSALLFDSISILDGLNVSSTRVISMLRMHNACSVLYVLEFPFRLARTVTVPVIFESAADREDGGGWQEGEVAALNCTVTSRFNSFPISINSNLQSGHSSLKTENKPYQQN
eukprot:SAG11_NODE_680_length_7781_cov_6.490497_4_plen_147_part_00